MKLLIPIIVGAVSIFLSAYTLGYGNGKHDAMQECIAGIKEIKAVLDGVRL
jgi:hypothetical protein